MKTTVSALKKVLVSVCTVLFISTSKASDSTSAFVSPNRQYNLLQNELNRLLQLEQNGGWEKIILPKKFYMKEQTDPSIKILKQRLHASGDLETSDTSSVFTVELQKAVMKLQTQFGQKANGVVDAQLVKELNVPLRKRIEQLQVNMDRYSSFTEEPEGIWLVANIPEYKLHVYEGQQHVFDMDIVVGKTSSRTATFNNEIKYIVFSPSWNVPESIVRNEILPAIRKSSSYLSRNNYVQTGYENGLPVIKQLPGPNNSLGQVKFVFPNSHNIYFHDTPAKSLFQLNKRAFSHGCVRLAEPAKLAEFLLKDTDWTPEKISAAMESGREQFVHLKTPVAVSIIYFTAWVDKDGIVHYREDIYGHDRDALASR